MNINFAFIRHGHGCHNAISPLYKKNMIDLADYKNFLGMKADPELTQLGVDASIQNGCVVSKILKNLNQVEMNPINIVGCSPLIRCMETTFYMTRKWVNPPNKIFVFPFLREIDERSSDIYSKESRINMDTVPSYAMKSIREQKDYLRSQGILDFFDFTFVEMDPQARREPGDILSFIKWFALQFVVEMNLTSKRQLNLFVTTHAGVLKHFSEEGFWNNSGIVVSTTVPNSLHVNITNVISLNDYLPKSFFALYNEAYYNDKQFYCPSSRCGTLCTKLPTQTPLKHLATNCDSTQNDTLSSES
jgi:hypothetical protein